MGDEDDLFREAMADVRPLADDREPVRKAIVDGDAQARRRAAVAAGNPNANRLALSNVPAIGPFDPVDWKRDGVQHGVHRKLRLGQYPIQASLDLHRRTVREAREDVWAFYRDALRFGLRLVLITHGKGVASETPGRLKSFVAHWLIELPEVLAYHSAQQRHGGTGAVYVLLRKSETMRRENREIHHQKGNPEHTR